MKKIFALCLILLLTSALAACQSSTPPPIPTALPTAIPVATNIALPATATVAPTDAPLPPLNSLDGPPLRLMKMFTKKNGWGLIADALLVTHDGGSNWFSVPLPVGQVDPLSAVFFVTMKELYLVVPAPDGNGGLIYHTTNGGGTWESFPTPFVHGQLIVQVNVAYFMEAANSDPGSDPVSMYLSVDYGATWNKTYPSDTSSNIPVAGLKTGFSYINVDRGWLGLAGQNQKIALFRTDDTGNSWSEQKIQEPENISSLLTSVQPPMFFANNQNDGILPVDFISKDSGDSNRVFYSTNDGGLNWVPGGSVVEGAAYTFLDPKNGWVWGKGRLSVTQDGGQTWQILPVAFGRSEHATCLSFVDLKTGWMVTTDAKNRVRIYNTTDGGSTWLGMSQ